MPDFDVMEDFRRQFLLETAQTLDRLNKNLTSATVFSDAVKRETFRTLHTVKGTAQTFGFNESSRLAHELETLLAADGNTRTLLIEGIELLQASLTENPSDISETFVEKLRAVVPNVELTADTSTGSSSKIPTEIYSNLSVQEKNIVGAAIRSGKSLTVIEVGFETVNFASELIDFRELLNSSGEIVATFPSADFSGDGKIGFQFLTANFEAVENLPEKSSVKILWSSPPEKPLDGIGEVLREIVRHGEEIAAKLDKQIEIKTQSGERIFSPAELKLIFEVLLHLARNAVDHGIEKIGRIEILIKEAKDGLHIAVADNGRGIEAEKIKAKALEKKLTGVENLSDAEIINLIFQPEFSTKSSSDEISGRGVGLDAVKYAVEKVGGKITVATEKGIGTTFEIILPRAEN